MEACEVPSWPQGRHSPRPPRLLLSLECCSRLSTIRHHISWDFRLFPTLALNSVLLSHNRKTLTLKKLEHLRLHPGSGLYMLCDPGQIIWGITKSLPSSSSPSSLSKYLLLVLPTIIRCYHMTITANHWGSYYYLHFLHKEMWHKEAKLVFSTSDLWQTAEPEFKHKSCDSRVPT